MLTVLIGRMWNWASFLSPVAPQNDLRIQVDPLDPPVLLIKRTSLDMFHQFEVDDFPATWSVDGVEMGVVVVELPEPLPVVAVDA